jgi:hypothetical protein
MWPRERCGQESDVANSAGRHNRGGLAIIQHDRYAVGRQPAQVGGASSAPPYFGSRPAQVLAEHHVLADAESARADHLLDQPDVPRCRRSEDRAARGGGRREEGAGAGIPTAHACTESRVNVVMMMTSCGRRQCCHHQNPSQRNRRRKPVHVDVPLSHSLPRACTHMNVNTVLKYGTRSAWQLIEGLLWVDPMAKGRHRHPVVVPVDRTEGTRAARPGRSTPRERSSRARFQPGTAGRIRPGIADKAASSGDPPRLRFRFGFTRDRGLPFGSSAQARLWT